MGDLERKKDEHVDVNLELGLSLSPPPSSPKPLLPAPPPPSPPLKLPFAALLSALPPPPLPPLPPLAALSDPRQHQAAPRQWRTRRNSSQGRGGGSGKDGDITPPYIWATNRRARIHNLQYLLQNNIRTITGDVYCKRCEARYTMSYHLESTFLEIGRYIIDNKESLNQRAPKGWMNPRNPDCRECKQLDCVKPVMAEKKRNINWLFLLLGKMLGCCTLEQLKYFCKHTKEHRTGAKDRVLFATYVVLCKQLDPEGPFHVRGGH